METTKIKEWMKDRKKSKGWDWEETIAWAAAVFMVPVIKLREIRKEIEEQERNSL